MMVLKNPNTAVSIGANFTLIYAKKIILRKITTCHFFAGLATYLQYYTCMKPDINSDK